MLSAADILCTSSKVLRHQPSQGCLLSKVTTHQPMLQFVLLHHQRLQEHSWGYEGHQALLTTPRACCRECRQLAPAAVQCRWASPRSRWLRPLTQCIPEGRRLRPQQQRPGDLQTGAQQAQRLEAALLTLRKQCRMCGLPRLTATRSDAWASTACATQSIDGCVGSSGLALHSVTQNMSQCLTSELPDCVYNFVAGAAAGMHSWQTVS